jgi:hypothetical protein
METTAALDPAWARLGADTLLVVHAAFVAWVALGPAAVWRWPRLAWLHLPALAWGVWISATGASCPLTPWEWRLRAWAGQDGHDGGFIEHYLVAWIYPDGLTRGLQAAIAVALIAVNAGVYGALWHRRRRPRPA